MKFLCKQLFILTVLPSIAFFSNAHGADFVVSTPTTTTNGAAGNVVNGNDTLLITDTGSITTVGVNAVSVTGGFNIVNNEGILRATSGQGINSTGFNNTLINNGNILIDGVALTHGMNSSGNGNHLVNKGFINTGLNHRGMQLLGGNGNNVINTGSINTDLVGIFELAGSGNTLINYGAITSNVWGIGGQGSNGTLINHGAIQAGLGIITIANHNVINTGTILTAFQPNSFGLGGISITNGTLTNSGSITTLNIGNPGIISAGTATINNSGKVLAYQANSFELAAGTTLNLLAPSFIGGVITLGPSATVSITTGPSQSNLWDFSTGTLVGGAPAITGSVPFFYNAATQQVATYDPTAFTALRDQLADVSGSASLLIQIRLDNACGASCRGNIWVSTFGSTYKYGMTSATLDYHFKYWGVVAGYDKMFYNNLILGAFGGYGKGFINSDAKFVQSLDNEADGAIFGVYGRKNAGMLFVDLGFSFGTLDHKDSRFVNDNLAPLGESNANGSYDGFWICPEVAIGANLTKFDTWTFSPNARYRYAWETIDSYTEKGSSSNASIPSQKIAVGEFKGEFAAKKRMNFGCVSGRIGYLLRNRLGNDSTNVTMIAQTVSIPVFYNHRNAGYIGLDAELSLGRSTTFSIGGELTGGGGIKGMKGEVALITTF